MHRAVIDLHIAALAAASHAALFRPGAGAPRSNPTGELRRPLARLRHVTPPGQQPGD